MASDTSVSPEISAILDKLRQKRIELAQISYDEDHETSYGRYGFIRKATLDQVRIVAVKSFWSAGGREDRVHPALWIARKLALWEPLSHPNILPLTGFHVSDDYSLSLLVTPWASGGHIEGYIGKHSPDLEARISLALDTAAGLKFLHDKKICHANLKSGNVVVLENGCAVLRDVGTATGSAIKDNAHIGLTATATRNEPADTFQYTSPELLLEPGTSHTLPSDVWAWGCLLLQILTGVLPYAACMSSRQISDFIAQGKPPADVFELCLPSDLRTLLLRCWHIKEQDRPTIDECFTRLVTAEATSPVTYSTQGQNLSNYQQLRVLYDSQRLQRLEGDSSSAQEALGQAKSLLLELENSFGVLWCDSTMASVQRSKCQYDSARILQQRVLETFQDISAGWGVASARYELGVLDAKQRNYAASQAHYKSAFELFQELRDPSGAASCRLGLGILDSDRGEYDDAKDQLQQALEAFRRLDNHSRTASCYQALGKLSFYQGEYHCAMSQIQEALYTFRSLGDVSEVAWCQRSLGVIDCALEKYEDARVRADEALGTFQRLGNTSGIAACQYDIGVIANERRNYIFAKKTLLHALELEFGLGDLSEVAYCKRELAAAEYGLYNYPQARLLLQEALETFQLLDDAFGKAGAKRGLGLIDYEEGKYSDACEQFQEALEAYKRLGIQSKAEFCDEALRKIQGLKSNER